MHGNKMRMFTSPGVNILHLVPCFCVCIANTITIKLNNMKKIVLTAILSLLLLGSENLMAQYKKIYLWDVTLSMKGYNPDDEDIYDEVLKWMIDDIDKVMNPSTTIMVCPFQAPKNNHGTILDTKTVLATPEGKSDIVAWIKSRNYTDVTYTDVAGAMKRARMDWVSDGDQVIILTDGKQSDGEYGGTPRLVEEIHEWCKFADSREDSPYALYFMLTAKAVDEEVQKAIEKCQYIRNLPPHKRSYEMFVLSIQDELKANIKDDNTVNLHFSTNSTVSLPSGVKVRITAPAGADYINPDGEYEIVNNMITIPLNYILPAEELKSYGDFLGKEYVYVDLHVQLITPEVDNAIISLKDSDVKLTLINKPEKKVKISIKKKQN